MRRFVIISSLLVAISASLAGAACVAPRVIPGTHIPDLPRNREIIKAVEEYRKAMEEINVSKLMAMAHKDYYEHSGTPTGADDYGYKGLLKVLQRRLKQVVSVRCSLKYMRIHWAEEKQAEVEVYVSASFQLKTDEGERWFRMTDYNKMVLVQQKDRWVFLRGM